MRQKEEDKRDEAFGPDTCGWRKKLTGGRQNIKNEKLLFRFAGNTKSRVLMFWSEKDPTLGGVGGGGTKNPLILTLSHKGEMKRRTRSLRGSLRGGNVPFKVIPLKGEQKKQGVQGVWVP